MISRLGPLVGLSAFRGLDRFPHTLPYFTKGEIHLRQPLTHLTEREMDTYVVEASELAVRAMGGLPLPEVELDRASKARREGMPVKRLPTNALPANVSPCHDSYLRCAFYDAAQTAVAWLAPAFWPTPHRGASSWWARPSADSRPTTSRPRACAPSSARTRSSTGAKRTLARTIEEAAGRLQGIGSAFSALFRAWPCYILPFPPDRPTPAHPRRLGGPRSYLMRRTGGRRRWHGRRAPRARATRRASPATSAPRASRFRLIDRAYFDYTGFLNLVEIIESDWGDTFRSKKKRWEARWRGGPVTARGGPLRPSGEKERRKRESTYNSRPWQNETMKRRRAPSARPPDPTSRSCRPPGERATPEAAPHPAAGHGPTGAGSVVGAVGKPQRSNDSNYHLPSA